MNGDDEMQMIPPDVVDRGNFVTPMGTRSMSSAPSVINSFKVFYDGQARDVDRQTYIYTVLSSELYGTSYYKNKGLLWSSIFVTLVAKKLS